MRNKVSAKLSKKLYRDLSIIESQVRLSPGTKKYLEEFIFLSPFSRYCEFYRTVPFTKKEEREIQYNEIKIYNERENKYEWM